MNKSLKVGPGRVFAFFFGWRMWFHFFVVTFLVSLLAFSVTDVLISKTVREKVEQKAVESATNVALTFAEIPQVQDNIDRLGGGKVIQPLAESVRRKTRVEFVVTYSREGIQMLNGPASVNQGEPLSRLLSKVLKGRRVTLVTEEAEGPALKSVVPVTRDGEVVGAVAVGVLLKKLDQTLFPLYRNMVQALLWGLLLSLSGSMFIAWNLKRIFSGKEPQEISLLFSQWDSLLESVHEGIVAVDEEGVVMRVNRSARSILGEGYGLVPGVPVDPFGGFSSLKTVLSTGRPLNNISVRVKESRLLVNMVPVFEKGKIRGALASFRDMTELKSLAEQITGAKMYAEALRAHSHEYKNKLHSIAGMIRLGQPEEALEYICHMGKAEEALKNFVVANIKSYTLAGIILAKSAECREKHITFEVDEDSFCGPLTDIDDYVITVVTGNLLENAMEAVSDLEEGRRRISLGIFDESDCAILTVRDHGNGIPDEIMDRIFEKGFTTKGDSSDRGYGLHNVWSAVVGEYGGEIDVETREGAFTQVIVNIPKRPRR